MKLTREKLVDNRIPGTQNDDGSWCRQKFVTRPTPAGWVVLLILALAFLCIVMTMTGCA